MAKYVKTYLIAFMFVESEIKFVVFPVFVIQSANFGMLLQIDSSVWPLIYELSTAKSHQLSFTKSEKFP